ncbi:hypothetical protein PTTG_00816, partial [Puccinia triticina 1-1 BBBD Race 1]
MPAGVDDVVRSVHWAVSAATAQALFWVHKLDIRRQVFLLPPMNLPIGGNPSVSAKPTPTSRNRPFRSSNAEPVANKGDGLAQQHQPYQLWKTKSDDVKMMRAVLLAKTPSKPARIVFALPHSFIHSRLAPRTSRYQSRPLWRAGCGWPGSPGRPEIPKEPKQPAPSFDVDLPFKMAGGGMPLAQETAPLTVKKHPSASHLGRDVDVGGFCEVCSSSGSCGRLQTSAEV